MSLPGVFIETLEEDRLVLLQIVQLPPFPPGVPYLSNVSLIPTRCNPRPSCYSFSVWNQHLGKKVGLDSIILFDYVNNLIPTICLDVAVYLAIARNWLTCFLFLSFLVVNRIFITTPRHTTTFADHSAISNSTEK